MNSQLGLAAEKGHPPSPLLRPSVSVSYAVIAVELTQQILHELLDYDPDSGALTWKHRDRKWFDSDRIHKSWNTRYAGTTAGAIQVNRRGYRRRIISLFRRRHNEHRVIWLYMTGAWPSGEIDHVDQDATNNSWGNLRDVGRLQNNLNQSMRSDNKSGATGVSWSQRSGKWLGRVVVQGRVVFNKTFEDRLDAARAVAAARKRHGLSRGHGSQRQYGGTPAHG